ncbi:MULTISPECIES: SpdD protein [unclassified Streptomyces]|uniref:SpdD protein n=1 Tax=unclassified Streptomyces TaxID=2593676 RepID=UPI003800027C
MFTPKIPPPDTAPTPGQSFVPPLTGLVHPPACNCHHTPTPAPAPAPAPTAGRPAVQLTPCALIVAAVGGTGVVLVIGTVLVSMLLATAITAVSVAVCTVVLRSLLNSQNKNR